MYQNIPFKAFSVSFGIDILIFAGVAVFLLFRLKDLLGRPEGRDNLDQHPFDSINGRDAKGEQDETYDPHKSPVDDTDNVVPIRPGETRSQEPAAPEVLHDDPEINAVLRDIRKVEPGFHPASFTQGAEGAYEMVLNGFADGDLNELRGLMSSQVFNDFKSEIDRRADAGETLETTLVGFDEVKIVGASLEGKTAEIDVLYTTQQVNIIRDSEGEMLNEDDSMVVTQVDEWTLVRKLASRDPNWTLVALSEVEPD